MSARSKSWVKPIFGNHSSEESCSASAREMGTNVKYGKRSIKFNNETVSPESNWLDLFAPNDSDELCVHSKKYEELKNWYCHCKSVFQKHPAQICLITGPSGTCKTAAVRVLAKEYNLLLQEWINPPDQEVIKGLNTDLSEGSSYYDSQVEVFKHFLLRASRYKSLFDGNKNRLLLVEDFPNALINDCQAFENILKDYTQYGKSPLIFIATDSKARSLNISYNLFPDEIKSKFFITHISFNPIAITLMQKAMKRFCQLMQQPPYNENYKLPSTESIQSITWSAQGDIRNALLNLHFASLKGAPQLSTVLVKQEKFDELVNNVTRNVVRGKRKKNKYVLNTVGRDEPLTIMHSLGRVLYPKWTDENQLVHNPDKIAESFISEPNKFIDFLQANYLIHFSNLSNICDASNYLSLCENMLTEYREESLRLESLTVGIRAIMITNHEPTNGFKPIRASKRLQITDLKYHHLIDGNIPKSLYATEFSTYINSIQKNTIIKS